MSDSSIMMINYVNRNGDVMRGALVLCGDPVLDAHATSKRYVDTQLANLDSQAIKRDGSVPMTGPLVLSGAPTLGAHATTRDYVTGTIAGVLAPYATIVYADGLIAVLTNPGGTIDARIAAAVADYVPLSGAVPMTGLLTLSGDPLLALEAATKQYVDALPVAGLSTYDAIVAPAGGDYTSVVTACATEPAGSRIYIKSGTYGETANKPMKGGQQLMGESVYDTIIDFNDANNRLQNDGGADRRRIENLTFQRSRATYYIYAWSEYEKIDNCHFLGNANCQGGIWVDGNRGQVTRCVFTGFNTAGDWCLKMDNYGQAIGNLFRSSRNAIYMASNGNIVGNVIESMTESQLEHQGTGNITGNLLVGNKGLAVGLNVNITGNYMLLGGEGIAISGAGVCVTGNNFLHGKVVGAAGIDDITIAGNTFKGVGTGIEVDGEGCTISGNTLEDNNFITLGGNSKYCCVVGNNLSGSDAATKISDAGVANLANDNMGVPALMDKHFGKLKNTSGGALVAGDVVVMKAVAAGDEVTTTVNQGDDMVYGMLDEGINNDAYGYIQDEGKTVKLKVNGVVNIAIGDFLGTFTAAGIAMKAAAGDMAFAIALEVYAGADSLGVIDALLVSPRKI